MITKLEASYLLTTYAPLFNKDSLELDSTEHQLICKFSDALHAVLDESASHPSVEELREYLRQDVLRQDYFKTFLKESQQLELFEDLVNDLLDEDLYVKANPLIQPRHHIDCNVLGINFRDAFTNYLKGSRVHTKKQLIDAASSLYISIINQHGLDADKIAINMEAILYPLLKDMDVNWRQINLLEQLTHALGAVPEIPKKKESLMQCVERKSCRDMDVRAFHALNFAFYGIILPNYQRNIIKKITKQFIKELDKLEKSHVLISQENSFFFNKLDKINIRERKRVINDLFFSLATSITQVSETIIAPEQLFNEHVLLCLIDKLSTENCKQIIITLNNNVHKLSNQDKSSLQKHVMNGQWIFNWLIKLIQVVQETFQMKTSSEKLLKEINTNTEFLISNSPHNPKCNESLFYTRLD